MTTERKLKLALCQISVTPGEIAKNAARAEEAMREAAAGGAGLIALPEMWATGFDFSRMAEYRESTELRGLETRFAGLARELEVEVAAGSWLHFGPEEGRPTNRAHFFDARGEQIAHYDKTHLFAPMAEERFLAAGTGPQVCNSALGRTAMAICYDLRFDDVFAAAAQEDCKAIIMCAAWPLERVETMVRLARERARDYGCVIIVTNCASPETGNPKERGYVAPIFGGESCVFGRAVKRFLSARSGRRVYFSRRFRGTDS